MDSHSRYIVRGSTALPLYRTDNGRATWANVQTGLLLQSLQHGQFYWFHFVDMNIGFVYYDGAQPLKTTDGGHIWSVVS